MHVVDFWLWSLRRGVGTPCRPAIITYVCKDDGRVCGGLGDRVRGQNVAFWQACAHRSQYPCDSCRILDSGHGLMVMPPSHVLRQMRIPVELQHHWSTDSSERPVPWWAVACGCCRQF